MHASFIIHHASLSFLSTYIYIYMLLTWACQGRSLSYSWSEADLQSAWRDDDVWWCRYTALQRTIPLRWTDTYIYSMVIWIDDDLSVNICLYVYLMCYLCRHVKICKVCRRTLPPPPPVSEWLHHTQASLSMTLYILWRVIALAIKSLSMHALHAWDCD